MRPNRARVGRSGWPGAGALLLTAALFAALVAPQGVAARPVPAGDEGPVTIQRPSGDTWLFSYLLSHSVTDGWRAQLEGAEQDADGFDVRLAHFGGGDRVSAPAEGASVDVDGELDIPDVALSAYQRAADRSPEVAPGCDVRWTILAGIGRIESNHGRTWGSATTNAPDGDVSPPILGPPLDGTNGTAAIRDTDGGELDGDPVWDRAVGPMQFIPSSWERFGRDGSGDGSADPNNYFDAALAAVAHLCLATPGDYEDRGDLVRALLGYNRSASYVATVLAWIDAYDGVGGVPGVHVAGNDGDADPFDADVGTGAGGGLDDASGSFPSPAPPPSTDPPEPPTRQVAVDDGGSSNADRSPAPRDRSGDDVRPRHEGDDRRDGGGPATADPPQRQQPRNGDANGNDSGGSPSPGGNDSGGEAPRDNGDDEDPTPAGASDGDADRGGDRGRDGDRDRDRDDDGDRDRDRDRDDDGDRDRDDDGDRDRDDDGDRDRDDDGDRDRDDDGDDDGEPRNPKHPDDADDDGDDGDDGTHGDDRDGDGEDGGALPPCRTDGAAEWVDELLAVLNRGDREAVADRFHADLVWRLGHPDDGAEEPRDDVGAEPLEALLDELDLRSEDGQQFVSDDAREVAEDLLVAFVAEGAESDGTDRDPSRATLVVDCDSGLVTEWWMDPFAREREED